MSDRFNGMEQLPGFPDAKNYEAAHDAKLDAQYPWLRNMFDRMMLTGIPQDLSDLFATYRKSEFSISAAVIVPIGSTFDVIGLAPSNRTNELKDSGAHAEMLAIDMATPANNKHVPAGAVLLSLLEPCAHCASGAVNSGVHHIIYGATQSDVRGKITDINGGPKPFRTEPADYDVRDFIQKRDPTAIVEGRYRRSEALAHMRARYPK